ncbi:MAG: hypothetical protein HLX51_11690 [Micrococcaceae bacterium]|nr:hypothetical protein [Micrococcaceae bacterium]
MTREEMLSRMSSAELTQWLAYEEVTGPLGAERDDALAALNAFYIMRALGAKKVKIDKLMPKWDRKPAQKWQDMKMIAQALTKQFKGNVKTTE